MNVVFDHYRDEASNIRTFFFKPEKPVHYTAGQYTQLKLPHKDPDNRGIKRWFTLSSGPEQEFVTITTKHADDKGSTFKRTLWNLKPGTEVHMAEPMGDFVLPKLIQTPLLFVAGGIGLTPFHSMAEWLAATGEARPITFLYSVRNEDEIVFQDTFGKAGIEPVIVVGEPSPSWGGERGRLSADLIVGLGKPTDDTLIYISGPEPMVEALEKDLKKAGLPKDRLVGDFFPNYDAI
jgi:ferredoxin-NADP reductase